VTGAFAPASDATASARSRRPDPTTLGYGVIPTSRKGRLICGAVFAACFLIAVAIVGRGSIGSVKIEGTTTEFAAAAGDGGLPAVPGLGPWEYTAGTWTVDRGAVGQPSDAAVTLATLTAPPTPSVEITVAKLADGVGLIFRYQDPSNYWGVRAVPTYGGWNIFKVVDGRETVVRVLVGQAFDGTSVGVQQSGTRFRVVLNGLVRSTFDDKALAKAPGVGMMSPGGDDPPRIRSITVGSFDGTISMRKGDSDQDEIVPSLNPGGT
jgi:hypothetical protein